MANTLSVQSWHRWNRRRASERVPRQRSFPGIAPGHFAARADATAGFRVFATARRLETVQELQDTLGIEIIQLDVTKVADVQRVRNEVALRTGGKLDVLVNNAFGRLFIDYCGGC